MDANSHIRRDHRIGIARPLHHCSHRCIRTALIATVNQLLSHVWLAIESEADLRACELRAPDTILIPPGTQYGAIQCNPENRNRLRYQGFATFCIITRNEQVSGSSPLVGSIFPINMPNTRIREESRHDVGTLLHQLLNQREGDFREPPLRAHRRRRGHHPSCSRCPFS